MINENPIVTHHECSAHNHSHLCWSALFAGALVGVGLGFLLHLFGVAIGLSAYSSSANGATVIAIGGFIGLLIGVIVAMGTAGFVAGYLGRFHSCFCHGGVIYGFVTWSLAIALSALLFVPLSNYISSYKNSLIPAVVIAHVDTTHDVSSSTTELRKLDAERNTTTVTPTDLAWIGWIVFLLFFIGALACCIGACWAMCCKRGECHTQHH